MYAEVTRCNIQYKHVIYNLLFVRYLSAINPDQKKSILDFCLKEGHEDYKIGSCDKCFNLYISVASSLEDSCTEQNHPKLVYRISSGSGSEEETVNSFIKTNFFPGTR